MKLAISLLLLLLSTGICTAQIRIDSSFPFQTDPNKKYSIYIPTSYNANIPHRLMLGLHPLNTNRWNAISWCDTLVDFAEQNQLILVCPDGGPDGKIDDAIDTAFTSFLLDSMMNWYNIDNSKMYVMGFSWGAKTTYSYGFRHAQKFGGFLPIGAAITGTVDVNGFLHHATNKAVYIVHGANDSPNSRFYPIRDSLINRNAIVNTLLMSGVGHTIDFPNRNQILATAYQWIDSVNCSNITVGIQNMDIESIGLQNLYPSILEKGEKCTAIINWTSDDILFIEYYTAEGKLVQRENSSLLKGINKINLKTNSLNKGLYIIKFIMKDYNHSGKLIVN